VEEAVMNFRAFILVALACGSALLSGASLVHAQTPPVADAVISELRYEPQYQITRPDGSFIPPSERVVTALVTWRSTETIGEFRILARRSTASAAESRGVVAASAGVDRSFEFKETWGFFGHPVCYIVQRGAAEAESCRPEPPSSGSPSQPPPSNTPWPAPTGLTMGNSYHGDPIITSVHLSWPVLQGFTGTYEVQRALTTERFRPRDAEFQPVATIAAAGALSGRVSFREEVDLVTMWYSPPCYRVRAVIGSETGPFSTEIRCAVLPTDVRPPVTPLPPDSGSGEGSAATPAGHTKLAIAAVAVTLGLLAALGTRLKSTTALKG
jgi:hypothetical protein